MKRIGIIFLIIAAVIVALWVMGRLTNALQFFTFPTTSNYPTIKAGDKFFASNLIKPKRFNFICYYAETPDFGKQIWTHRLCGLEGDTVEIKNGDLYVNNQSVDKKFSLAHDYIFTSDEIAKLKVVEKIDEASIQKISNDSFVTYASDKIIINNSIKATRFILPKDYNDEYITNIFGSHWNQDNFGPVIVPQDKYFVLGDNRLDSRDSRYLGFIDKSKYIATVLGR